MCGIAGTWRKMDVALLDELLRSLAHRGPDGWGMWTTPDGTAALGHVRLDVPGLDHGNQPISNEDGSLWLVADGEIYNHLELRATLTGHTFHTNNPMEVVLHLYEQSGPAALAELDGMFAIALWSARDGLLLARDRLGAKPLAYCAAADGGVVFASEAQALTRLAAPVAQVPPGHWWRPGAAPEPYWQQPVPLGTLVDGEMAVDLVDRALQRMVAQYLPGTGPVGVLLSGGLDSSLIAAHARCLAGRRVHSFAVGLHDAPDLAAARAVAAELDLIHHERILTLAELRSALPRVAQLLNSNDPVLLHDAVGLYLAAELAAQHVPVVLTGEGADDLFAGHPYLVEFSPDPAALDRELYRRIGALHLQTLPALDRLTAVHGLECRAPFLDHKLVAVAAQVSPGLKWLGSLGKWVLRQAAVPYLPAEIVWRKQAPLAVGAGIASVLSRVPLVRWEG